MLNCQQFYNILQENEIDFFTGIPDSLLKDFCAYVSDNTPPDRNVISANEGGSIGLAVGYHLATNKIPFIYLQNSGFGNIINPLLSIADPDVYSIPMLIMIGWRGEPGGKDEPQHKKQGRVTIAMLDSMQIPYEILPDEPEAAKNVVEKGVKMMNENSSPFVLVVRKGTFEEYQLQNEISTNYPLNREMAVKLVIDQLGESDIVVSTTGKTSREVFEYREEKGQGHDRDFLTVGAMGHASQIALGIALQKKDRQIFCLDGDGAIIMHMGSLTMGALLKSKNFKHVVFNNGAHDSVGGQPTIAFSIDFCEIARSAGYNVALRAESDKDITGKIKQLRSQDGPAFLEIRVNKGARSDLGRPTRSPVENKADFMQFISK